MKNQPIKKVKFTIWALLIIPSVIVLYKLFFLGYSFRDILPRTQFTINYELEFDGHGNEVEIRTFLPISDERQQITAEKNSSPGMYFTSENSGLNRQATWIGTKVGDASTITYTFSVLSSAIHFKLDPKLPLPKIYPSAISPYLRPEENIQVDHPEIQKTLTQIKADQGTLIERLRRLYNFTAKLRKRPFKGTTDALTALRLGEASCNGKSRLFVAMARAAGIPARLVGGLILETGSKRTSHQWVEIYVAGHWVPFDPTNRHFARLPDNYLLVYLGDEVFFRHSADINFNYQFVTTTSLVPSPKTRATFRFINFWSLFERLGLSFVLLRTILMLPVGALVVVLFRNVIGMPTFGTFLPALIAAAAGETGLLWGLVGILAIVGLASLVRMVFHRLELLHSPSLAILLATVAISILAIALVADHLGLKDLAYISIFPIAVMAITSERFFLSLTEQGVKTAVKELLGTMLVISACYVAMNSLALLILIIDFPEVLLFVVAGNVYLGRWVGVRLFEYLRFRNILFKERVG